jgi:hypothetical protein
MELLRYLDVKTDELANLWGLAAKQLTALGKLQLTLSAPKHTVEHVEAIILYQRTRDMTDFENSGGRALFVYTSTGLARQRKTIPSYIDNGAFESA